jgi:hypothetical protein
MAPHKAMAQTLVRGVTIAAIASGLLLSACGGVKVPFVGGHAKPAKANAQTGSA